MRASTLLFAFFLWKYVPVRAVFARRKERRVYVINTCCVYGAARESLLNHAGQHMHCKLVHQLLNEHDQILNTHVRVSSETQNMGFDAIQSSKL